MERRIGVLIISHGSRDEKWVELVDNAVHAMQLKQSMPVVSCFLEIVEGRLIQDGIDELESQDVTDIIAVPLFVSSGSTHVNEIGWALGAYAEAGHDTDLEPFRLKARLHYLDPMDDEDEVVEMVREHISCLAEQPSEAKVLIVAHGSATEGFYQKWSVMLERFAHKLKMLGGYKAVDYAMLLPDQLHEKLGRWDAQGVTGPLIIAPLFMSEGYFTQQVIPSRLEGYTYRYNGKSLLPHSNVTRWMERQVHLCIDSIS